MRDVKSPLHSAGATRVVTASTLVPWLDSVGLNDLVGPVLYADQREPWTFDCEDGRLARDVHALGVALSTAAPTNGHDQPLSDEMATDLIYLLAFLRTS